MPLSPLRIGENASTSTARTTGGHCWHLTGSHAGVAKQRTARLGRQPVDAGTRGAEKDVQESVITRLLRHCKLASVPPPRAPARVRQATFAWVASVTTSRVASGATCVQRKGAHPSERVPSRLQSLPPAFLRRPFRGIHRRQATSNARWRQARRAPERQGRQHRVCRRTACRPRLQNGALELAFATAPH
jgi:hypothetical protein